MELTLNEKIYKVLTTKVTKENKYMKELEAMGLIVYDDEDSSYNYWKIENPITDRDLVISKDYKNNKRLYGNMYPVNNAVKDNIKKVDFISYLNTNRIKCHEDMKTSTVETYKNVKWHMNYHSKRICEIENQIKKLERDLASHKKDLKKYQEEKNKLFEI